MTLTEFLLARIAEDEAESDEVHHELCDHLPNPQGALTGPCDCGVPAKIEAECAAKRRIVEMQRNNDELRYQPGFHYKAQIIDAILRALALPYADHPDFDEAWRA